MKSNFRAASPEDLEAIRNFLARAFGAGREAPMLLPAAMNWKYWTERGDWSGPRAYLLERDGAITAFAGLWPVTFGSGAGAVRGVHIISVSYRDKYGSLGKIAALAAIRDGRAAQVSAWVMSCRAFSRRIEHQTLRYLFDRFELDEVVFDYTPTPRNGPLTDFLTANTGAPPSEGVVPLTRERFEQTAPPLFHTVEERLPA